jgi:hypothetical protein
MSANLFFHPPIVQGGTKAENFNFYVGFAASNCSSSSPDGCCIVELVLTGRLHATSNDCTGAYATAAGGAKAKYHSPKQFKAIPSQFAFTSTGGAPPGTIQLTGTVTSGSFGGDNATLQISDLPQPGDDACTSSFTQTFSRPATLTLTAP